MPTQCKFTPFIAIELRDIVLRIHKHQLNAQDTMTALEAIAKRLEGKPQCHPPQPNATSSPANSDPLPPNSGGPE